ncbi:hypothetical protein [Chondromyces crocatus]|uniref:STAS/SEC14 domain-containing protein n=1 Tax=Chondromyces crocatus TaxID=52 RepID=A0A0K1EAT1_CHOCO|nr:hypothetical protein [Chondromyces crocatus]AKT37787.1 uncharacterized protein CMC5_019290 [Chondromyces crocatus]
MFLIKVDRIRALVLCTLWGRIELDEMRRFDTEFGDALTCLQGRNIRINADFRGLKPVAPQIAEILRRRQEHALDCGATKIAEVADSEVLSLQLTRIARESGADRITRRFPTDLAARVWLLDDQA